MLFTILFLSVVGAVGAMLLFTVAKKFHVEEDPRIGQVQEALPGANCGGCGYPGCGGFASACVASESLDGLFCPVGGNETMSRVASILGREASAADPLVAVVRCNGNCQDRPRTNMYDGATSCKISTSLYGGETGCTFGCHGLGDCCVVCNFDAIHINPETKLPEVDEDKCTACGACVKACPKFIIELRKKGPKGRRVFVSCVNKDKGGLAMKACKNACIGCSKCLKECNFEAITIENNLSYIDHTKCRLCRKCVAVCPTNAIHEIGFPPRKEKPADAEVTEKPAGPVVAPPSQGTAQPMA
ncbi:Fe-S cluster domain-containing protein [Porphyromonas sp.]|uniref:Fe-S cluster domain-containing protein n=1 Tax=Porphyromonas sp. TaxID=1924944 RepID=UPI0026DBE124|nr:Fe-S cluster domain-containing protein [Porphyromonas sp.]MDO4695379.1 Fe-S cluster domain-containing protein [Porphyromonas sp.]MDO4770494.1 Fe-S cluster domain-containing protein [Porphyromonas sp.]